MMYTPFFVGILSSLRPFRSYQLPFVIFVIFVFVIFVVSSKTIVIRALGTPVLMLSYALLAPMARSLFTKTNALPLRA